MAAVPSLAAGCLPNRNVLKLEHPEPVRVDVDPRRVGLLGGRWAEWVAALLQDHEQRAAPDRSGLDPACGPAIVVSFRDPRALAAGRVKHPRIRAGTRQLVSPSTSTGVLDLGKSSGKRARCVGRFYDDVARLTACAQQATAASRP